jgi:3-hydroxyacyl-[acyl-carrier-protein] dehydratase
MIETSPDQTIAAPAPARTAEPASTPAPTTLDISQIMAILPHRYPFLLIDRVLELERKERIVAIKNVTINEPFFQGHYPGFPIMPAVLLVEAIAQTGGALLLTEIEDRENKLMLFAGVDSARFRRPVTPGDQLRIEVKVKNWRPKFVRMSGSITIDGKLCCDAIVTCAIIDKQAKEPAAAAPEAAE